MNLNSETELDAKKYLLFRVGAESYACPLLDVREVIEFQEPKFIPNMLPSYLGVINIRGSIVGVIDLRSKFNLSQASPKQRVLLVCDTALGPLAAVVERVEAVIELEPKQIDRTAPVQARIPMEYFGGIAQNKKDLITILDLLKAMGGEALQKNQAA